MVLDLVNDGLVLEETAVVGEVDGLGLLGQDLDLAAGIIVALLERLQRGGGLAAEAEGGRNLGPVDLECGAALFRVRGGVLVSRFARADSRLGGRSGMRREMGSLRPTAAIVTGGEISGGGGEKRGEVSMCREVPDRRV